MPIEDTFKQLFTPCANIMVVGEAQRFMACLITFKVDVDLTTFLPSKNLTVEAKAYFKKEMGLDFSTSDEACQHPRVVEIVQKYIEETN